MTRETKGFAEKRRVLGDLRPRTVTHDLRSGEAEITDKASAFIPSKDFRLLLTVRTEGKVL
jgi:hypothetical protein